jgi:hypothetical protein
MTFKATANHIEKELNLNIQVADLTSPVIIGETDLVLSYGETPTIIELLKDYSVSDNVDQLTYEDIDVVDDGGYSEHAGLGSYRITIAARDLSGNIGYLDLEIDVVDQSAPKIIGPDNLVIYTTDEAYTEAYILSQYQGIDNVDDEVSIYIAYNAYEQNVNAGVYQIGLESIDSNGNKTTRDIYVHVVENQGPVFEVEEYTIYTTTKKTLNETEIQRHLKNYVSQQNSEIQNLSVIYNEYENHENKAGSYYVYYDYELNEEVYTSRLLIEVDEVKTIIDYWYLGVLSISVGFIVVFSVNKTRKYRTRKKELTNFKK